MARPHLVASVALVAIDLALGLYGGSMALALLSAYALQAAVSATVLLLDGPITRSASERHPFGLGKAESASIMGLSVVVMLVVGGLAAAAMHSWLDHRQRPPTELALLATGATLAVCWLLGRQARRPVRASSTAALEAHLAALQAQFLAAALVLVALVAGGVGALFADAVVAAALAAHVLWCAGRELYRATRGLLDASAEPEVLRRITSSIRRAHPARRSTVKTLRRGQDLFISATVEVDGDMPLAEAELLRRDIAQSLRRDTPGAREVLVDFAPPPCWPAPGERSEP